MTNPDAIPSFHSLAPPVTALEATALELLLAAGLLGRQTLFGDSLPVVVALRAGFGNAPPLSSTVAAFLIVGSNVPAVRDAGRLQLDETFALFFVRAFSASLGFGEGLLLAFGCRCCFFVLGRGRLLL
jgi:hypothetical protein